MKGMKLPEAHDLALKYAHDWQIPHRRRLFFIRGMIRYLYCERLFMSPFKFLEKLLEDVWGKEAATPQ